MYKSLLLAAFAVALAFPATAQTTAAHTVTVEVETVRAIEVGADLTLTAVAPSPGDADLRFTGTSTYGVITNATGDVVTVQADAIPADLELEADYGAPTNATGGTDYAISDASATTIVTGITQVSESGLSIAYEAIAELTLAAGTYDIELTYTIQTP